jgi:quinol monooxygenase YgiN
VIVVAVRVRVKPAKRQEFVTLAQGMLEPSRAEKGCVSYNFFADTLDANAFLYFEEWESSEALRSHSQTEHFVQYMKALPETLDPKFAFIQSRRLNCADPSATPAQSNLAVPSQ